MRLNTGNSLLRRSVVTGAMVLMLGLTAQAQILPIKPPLPKPAAKPVPPKPAAKPVIPPRPAVTRPTPVIPPRTATNTPGIPPRANGRTPLPGQNGPANPAALPNGRAPLGGTSATQPNGRPSLSSLTNQGANGSPASSFTGNQGANPQTGAGGSQAAGNGQRAAIGNDGGLGTFPGASNYSLTPYSCFRSGNQVLCDFDLSNQNNVRANAKVVYNDTHLVNGAGRTIGRSDAYFVDSDGSKFTDSQITPGSKVRMVMVFENVPATTTSVSMAQGSLTIPNVAITSQEGGSATQTAGTQGAPEGAQQAKKPVK